jgi:predicted TIM-barrel fold metal-dependent hydrolase
MTAHHFSRRQFLLTSTLAITGSGLAFGAEKAEPIIDIHQHTNYGGQRDPKTWQQMKPARNDDQLLAHQRMMGATTTILLPAGRPVNRPSTHENRSNGLESTCSGNDAVMAMAKEYPKEFLFAANEVADLDDAPQVIEKYLKLGAVMIAEQKFGVDCDSQAMQKLYVLAAAYNVPILMHWQVGSYNYGYERFYKMLEKYPKTTFIGHAQTFWANIDKKCDNDPHKLYPGGKVTPGGITDKYLSDYPNMFGDLSAGSGHNALKRDPDHARAFIERHQAKLVFGSDCTDTIGRGGGCSGWGTINLVRQFSSSKTVERKLLYENARKMFRLA